MANRIELSDDRTQLRIHGPEGRLVTLHSRQSGGFTDVDLGNAQGYQFNHLRRGQVNRAWRFESKQSKRVIYLHISTGPPTWWFPRVRIGFKKSQISAGWLRLGVAVKIGEKE